MFKYCSKLITILMPNFLFMPKIFLSYYFLRKEINVYAALVPFYDATINNRIPFFFDKIKIISLIMCSNQVKYISTFPISLIKLFIIIITNNFNLYYHCDI